MRFIQLDEYRRLNLEHVICIDYYPATSDASARLLLITTATEMETVSRYDGDTVGCAATSITFEVDGEQATALWKQLSWLTVVTN